MSDSAPLKWQSGVIEEDAGRAGGSKSVLRTRKGLWSCAVLCLGGALIAFGGGLVRLHTPETPLEFHKEKYLRARNGHWMDGWTPGGDNGGSHQRRVDHLRFHQNALLKLGYLQQRVFIISNRPASKVQLKLIGMPGDNMQFVTIEPRGTNRLVIIAVREDMPLWEDLVREGDVKQ